MVRSQVKLRAKILLRNRSTWAVLAQCSFFVWAALQFLPRLGLENDEALFPTAFYRPGTEQYVVHLGHSRLPLMLISYLGTLKSWIYRPLLWSWGTSVAVLRIPVVLAGAASIWLFYLLLRRIAGARAGLIGCSLLSLDALYLLTTCFDWGPVALQHLLTIGGMLALVRFWQERSDWALGVGFFLFGLALWDKAVAFWMLSGLLVAAIVTIPRQILDRATLRRLAIVILSLAAGALPLIVYNVRSGMATFRGTAVFDASDIRGKARALEGSLNGSVLFGWLVAENWQIPQPHEPRGWQERASTAVAKWAGHPRQSLLPYALAAALLLAPLAGGAALRAIVLAAVAMAVAWFQMAFTAGAGGGAHHVLLLWPLPQAIIGISLAAASRRFGRAGTAAVAAVTVILAASNLAVTNEYFSTMVRNGGGVAWTDAIFPLSDYLEKAAPPAVFCVDWGYLDSLRVLSNGRLPVRVGNGQMLQPELGPEDRRALDGMISGSGNLFLAHTSGVEFYRGLNARLSQYAETAGYRRETLAVFADSFGRPTFEVYRFIP